MLYFSELDWLAEKGTYLSWCCQLHRQIVRRVGGCISRTWEKKKKIYIYIYIKSEVWFFFKQKRRQKNFRRPMSKMKIGGHLPESVNFRLIPFWKLRSELVKGMNRPHDCLRLWGPECLWIIKEKVIRFCILLWLTVFYCVSLYSCFLKIRDRHKVYMVIPDWHEYSINHKTSLFDHFE